MNHLYAKFFENDNNNLDSKVRNAFFEEKSEEKRYLFFFSSCFRNNRRYSEPQLTIGPTARDLHQPIESIVEISLRRSQRLSKLG